jgi:hypothetical protein
LKPLTAARPDRFSPSEVRPASQMTPGKAPAITSASRTNGLVNDRAQPAKRVKKPATNPEGVPDGAASTDGTTKPAPHPNQESFIIPGTATGPDRPLTNPQKTASEKAPAEKNSIAITGPVSTAGAGSPPREQHQ